VVVVGVWGVMRGDRRRFAMLAIGAAIPLVLCAIYFIATGTFGEMWRAIFVFTPRYTRLGWDPGAPALAFRAIADWLVRYSALPLAGLVLLLWARPKDRDGVPILGALIAVQLAGVALQAKFHLYHFGGAWPPTMLLVALGLWRLGERTPWVTAALVLLLLLMRNATMADVNGTFWERTWARAKLLAGGMSDRRERDRLGIAPGYNPAAVRAAGAWLHDHVPADRPIFLWGFPAELYDAADRDPASRWFYNAPQRVPFGEPYREQLIADLVRRPPAALIVMHNDRVPDIAGGDKRDSAELVDAFPALRDLIAASYAPSQRFGAFDIYVSKGDQ
jgi:hypothetical protein